MMSYMEGFLDLKIQLKDIKAATDNFGPNKRIGDGGFGSVYKGELSLPEGRTMVAFKRLDKKSGQGNIEFWQEIMMLSKYRHENLVSLLHFCDEDEERILVYEYASRGSLDRYLSDINLTWTQRLKICVGVAHALNYLHDPMESHQRVFHRDIKSANILLDEKWTAKVSDFGLSKFGPANQPQTFLVSKAVGTPGYCDPLYWEMGFLTKESDVYSFGVVLLEIMCGRLCFEYYNGERNILVPKWRKCYDEKRLDEIIFLDLKEQMDPGSLNSFSAIAYRCVKRAREERPTMAEIVKELEVALKQQEAFENPTKRHNPPDFVAPPLPTRSQSPFVAEDKTWTSKNKNEEIIERVSATKCISGVMLVRDTAENSRFSNVLRDIMCEGFKVEVSTQFLSPHVTYTVNLVFKHADKDLGTYVPFKYKLDEETGYSNSCIAHVREDGWLMTELYKFTSYQNKHDFRIQFLSVSTFPIYPTVLEGIEFRPMERETSGKKSRGQKLGGYASHIKFGQGLRTKIAARFNLVKR